MELQRSALPCQARRSSRKPWHQLDAFLDHVVQNLLAPPHLFRVSLDGDHRHFDGALAQRLARAVDGGVATSDDRDARPSFTFDVPMRAMSRRNGRP